MIFFHFVSEVNLEQSVHILSIQLLLQSWPSSPQLGCYLLVPGLKEIYVVTLSDFWFCHICLEISLSIMEKVSKEFMKMYKGKILYQTIAHFLTSHLTHCKTTNLSQNFAAQNMENERSI